MVTAAQSRHSDTNITAIFAHILPKGIYFLSFVQDLVHFSCFLGYFLLSLDQIIKLEVNICLLDYNYLLLFNFHYYLPLYIPNVLGPIRLEPVVNPNQHTFSVTYSHFWFIFASAWNFLCCLFRNTFFLPEPHSNYKCCHCTINEV